MWVEKTFFSQKIIVEEGPIFKKNKAIASEKSSIFRNFFFVLEANLLASVWLERGRIAFSLGGKTFFDKRSLSKRVQYLKKVRL